MVITAKQLFDKYKTIDKKLKDLALSPQYHIKDNRRHVFGVLRMQVLWTESMLNIMEGLETKAIPDQVAEFVFTVHPNQRDFYKEFFLIARISFISNFNFQIENFFKILLVELGIKNIPAGFYNIVQEILTKTKMPYAQKKFDTIYTLARIRNAFHSNGIHTESTKSTTINGIPFHFIKGKKVDDVSYENLAVLIDEIITILEEIVNSSEVKKITNIVPKLYIPK